MDAEDRGYVTDNVNDFLAELDDLGPTVGYCSRCGEVRSSFYTCRDGGETVALDKERP